MYTCGVLYFFKRLLALDTTRARYYSRLLKRERRKHKRSMAAVVTKNDGRRKNVADDGSYCPQLATAVSKLCTWQSCDRKLVFEEYLALKNSVDSSLQSIDNELIRGQRLKAHPHSVVFFVDLPLPNNVSSQARAYVNDVRSHSAQTPMALRNFIVERTVDIVRRLNSNSSAELLDVIDHTVEFCLLYQISIDTLLGLHENIDLQFNKIGQMHVAYDKLLHTYEIALSNNDEPAMAFLTKQISDAQYALMDEVAVIQRLFNQVPFAMAHARSEHDFCEWYGVDDSVPVHQFLSNDYTKKQVNDHGTKALQVAYSKLKHHWRDFGEERALAQRQRQQ